MKFYFILMNIVKGLANMIFLLIFFALAAIAVILFYMLVLFGSAAAAISGIFGGISAIGRLFSFVGRARGEALEVVTGALERAKGEIATIEEIILPRLRERAQDVLEGASERAQDVLEGASERAQEALALAGERAPA